MSASTFSNDAAPDGDGGAIDNYGTLIVSTSTFSDNTAAVAGAIFNSGGTLTVSTSTFSGNAATGNGGAIATVGGTVTVSASSFSENTAPAAYPSGQGGAIYDVGAVFVVSGSTFSANTSGNTGGAINNAGALTVSTSTFSGNTADRLAGAIENLSDLTVWASTFSGNSSSALNLTIQNWNGLTTLWAAADIFDGPCNNNGTWDDEGYNVASDETCLNGGSGDVDYNGSLTRWLSPLGDYGGPTETMPPLTGAPAIGLVSNSASVTINGSSVALCPTTDQRGEASAPGHACDAGAVQGGGTLFAYAIATTSGLTSCPKTSIASEECTLGEALSLVTPAGTVYLASVGPYVGNWTVNSSASSSSAPLTIEPAPGITNPDLNGNRPNLDSGCPTSSCEGPVLTTSAFVDLVGVTISDGYADLGTGGGAIYNEGTLTVSGSTFQMNFAALEGGAIYNGGTLTVSASTFSGNTSNYDPGGAIYNEGTLTVSASTFSGNRAATNGNTGTNDGGAIFNGGTLTVSTSTFSGNTATDDGGAIDNGGTLTVSTSTFSGNTADYGGAIYNGGTLSVWASTFSGNTATDDGGAISNYEGTTWVAANVFEGPPILCDQEWPGTWRTKATTPLMTVTRPA